MIGFEITKVNEKIFRVVYGYDLDITIDLNNKTTTNNINGEISDLNINDNDISLLISTIESSNKLIN
jgi:hypothetical protein